MKPTTTAAVVTLLSSLSPHPEKLNLNIVKRKYGLQSQRNIRDNTRILTFGKNAIFGVEKWGSLHLINSLHWNNRQDWVVPADPPPRHNIRYKYKKERKYQVWFSFVTLMAVATSLYFARERGGAPSSTICFHGYGYGFNHGRSHYPAGRLMPLHSLQWFQVHPKAPKRLRILMNFALNPGSEYFSKLS